MPIITLAELENKLNYFYSHFQCANEQCFCYQFPNCTKGKEMQSMDEEAFENKRREILKESQLYKDKSENYLQEQIEKLKEKLSQFPYPYTFKKIRPNSVKTLGNKDLNEWIEKEDLEKEISNLDSILNFQEKQYSPRKPIMMVYKYYANDASRDYYIHLRLLNWIENHLGIRMEKEETPDNRIKSWASKEEIEKHFIQLAEKGFMTRDAVINFLRANFQDFEPKTELEKISIPGLTQKDLNLLFREFALVYDRNQRGRYVEMMKNNFSCFDNSTIKSIQGNFAEYPPKHSRKFLKPTRD